MCHPKIASEGYRMTPAVFLNYSYRKIFSLQLGPKRIVMTYGCCSTKKIPYTTPP